MGKEDSVSIKKSAREQASQKKTFVSGSAKGKATTNAKGGCVKTVILPHEDLNRLGVETAALTQFLAQQEALFHDTV